MWRSSKTVSAWNSWKSLEGFKTWGRSRQWEILVVTRLGMAMVEIMGIVQLVAIGPFEEVCGAKTVLIIEKVYYHIVTHQSEKLDNDEY